MILWSHNAYWFQGAPSLWGRERQAAHPEALAALTGLYASLGADVLLLQEVPDTSVAAALGEALDMHWHFVPGGERPDYGGGILWRRDLVGVVRDLTDCRTAAGRRFERICMHLVLQMGAYELSVINLHLSSNRFAPDGRGEAVRLGELARVFDEVLSADAVAGDFNARPDSGVYDLMLGKGYRDPHDEPQCKSHLEPHLEPHLESGAAAAAAAAITPQRIDYVWVDEKRLRSVPLGTPAPFVMPRHSDTALSDHLPVGVEITLAEQRQ